jgi:hypothetical protein
MTLPPTAKAYCAYIEYTVRALNQPWNSTAYGPTRHGRWSYFHAPCMCHMENHYI